jgi:hypothetical protein
MRPVLALLSRITNWKSWIATLPAPAPPPVEALPARVSPKLQDSTSISSLCFASELSPLMPSNLMK